VTDLEQNTDERFARIERATAAIRPSPGFAARVMRKIGAERELGWLDATWLSSRRLLPIAALAAALAVVWAVQSDKSVDDELAASYGALELE
jgi:hypothetical protein